MIQYNPAFYANFHMTPVIFEMIFQKVQNHLIPLKRTRPIDGIPARHRLALTLEYVLLHIALTI